MSVFSVFGKVVKIVVDVIIKIVPLMDLIGELVPSLRDISSQLQHLVDEGGEVADDFVDNNVAQFETIKEFGAKLRVAGESVESLMTMIISSASDDSITPDELQEIYEAVQVMIEDIAAAGDSSKKASVAAKVLKNA